MAPPAVGHSGFSPKSTKSSVGPGSPGSSGHGAASLAVGAGAGGFGAGAGAGAAPGGLPRTRNRTPRVGLPAIMVGSVKIPTSALSQPEGALPRASTRVLIFVALATRLLSTLLNDKMNLFFSLPSCPRSGSFFTFRIRVRIFCMSSEHFRHSVWQFKRVSGSSGLKVQAAIAC